MAPGAGAGADNWNDLHDRLDRLRLPQRPDAAVAGRYAQLIAGHDDRVLLLGVTRELAGLGRRQTVVDWNRAQIEQLWPSGRPDREAVLADWRAMELPHRYTAAIGDGSLSTLAWPDDYTRALGRVAHALVPGGRLVVRCYIAPDEPEALADVATDIEAGREADFHATRWRVAMAVAGPRGNVAVAEIWREFERVFPDRQALSARTGWSLATIALIDAFRASPLVYSFVTRQAVLDALPAAFTDARFVPSGEYPLSGRCPFLVAERAG